MTEQRNIGSAEEGDGDIRRLLTLAGPRLQPPPELEERVRAATMAAFDALPEQPVERRTHRWLALAAGLLVAVGLGAILLSGLDSSLSPAGQVLYATGGYTVRGTDAETPDLQPGSIVRTSREGRLLIGLGGDRTLRMDQGTSLTLHSSSEIWLHGGRIYVDAAGSGQVRVVTQFASVTDVGTRFEVTADGESLQVAVREGRVNVRLGDEVLSSEARPGTGELLAIEGMVLVGRAEISTTGERWRWTQTSRPQFAVGDRFIGDYLAWAARESGRTLIYASPIAQQQAGLRTLSGGGTRDADPISVAEALSTTSNFVLLEGEPHELVIGLRNR
jgi:hypothetical protein